MKVKYRHRDYEFLFHENMQDYNIKRAKTLKVLKMLPSNVGLSLRGWEYGDHPHKILFPIEIVL